MILKKINYKILVTCLSILLGSAIIAFTIYITSKPNDKKEDITYDPNQYIEKSYVKDIKSISEDKNQKVIALIFSDTECIFCKKFQLESMDKLIDKYKENVTFKYVFLPFRGDNSVKHAISVECASKQSKNYKEYYNYIKYFFTINDPSRSLTQEELDQIANKAELDSKIINDCTKEANKDQIEKSYIFAQEQEVNSTPQIFILKESENHVEEYVIFSKIIGARDIKYFEKVIDKALK